jgi:hypothetical protein
VKKVYQIENVALRRFLLILATIVALIFFFPLVVVPAFFKSSFGTRWKKFLAHVINDLFYFINGFRATWKESRK